MSDKSKEKDIAVSELFSGNSVSRRNFLAATAGITGVGCANIDTKAANDRISVAMAKATSKISSAPKAPFDTLRDYVAAIEAHGLLLRFDRIDQDAYEGTAIVYALSDKYGWYEGPSLLFENVKQNGVWIKGPLLINQHGHWDTECITFGLEPVKGNARQSYQKALDYTRGLLVDGNWPTIDPIQVPSKQALCKQNVLTGDDIDVTKFAFIQSNPADGGRYVNTGALFTKDPDMGVNFGTYRCQIRGPKILGVNPEPNQTGWKMLMAAKERGEKVAKISIALGQDPIVWTTSSSRMVSRIGKIKPVDEFAVAGGVRGKAVEIVKSETNDIMVPANCEMVIEGEVPLQEKFLPEGPFGEMYGYLGLKKEENFWMNITAITHRNDPLLVNQFTGATRGYPSSPVASLTNERFSKMLPGLIEIHQKTSTTGWAIVKIKKTEAGQGLKIGKRLASIIPIFKITVVVDEDIDIYDDYQVGLAMGSRYTPATSTEIFSGRGMPLDPSSVNRRLSSKIIIDATRQFPEEGGPDTYPELNRTLMDTLAPNARDQIMNKWGDILNGWGKTRY
ncbi:MAG: UbiD family decarboxylase [Pseudomonadota bacterium]|nr:UbiD family decarboxylase [Pseudomonadota bacterium]